MTTTHHPREFLLRYLVTDPEAVHYRKVKAALWLFLYLLLEASATTGRGVVTLPEMARETGFSEETLRSWLGHLRKGGYVTVRKRGPELHIGFPLWPGPRNEPEPRRLEPGVVAKIIPEHVGDAEVSEADALAKEVATTLHDPKNLHSYALLVEQYPASVIKRALAETKAVPAERIKKSRGALFTYLVKRYAKT